jgi:hypothetical protein
MTCACATRLRLVSANCHMRVKSATFNTCCTIYYSRIISFRAIEFKKLSLKKKSFFSVHAHNSQLLIQRTYLNKIRIKRKLFVFELFQF